ncbi:MAG: HlyD family efflux transporter periplasmic adaptor subunit, partial [Oscillochloris sp.]|nr:HlyD family efflux transporter periplasmic adaptor subunit [Oscillochloris sp.]
AQLTLASQRESLAAAKVTAESAMTTAANSLRDAQDSYSTIYWDNREQEKLPGDLSQSAKDEESAALRAVHTAEENFKQAQLSYEQAKQDEITGVAQAEADLKDAQVQLDDLLAGSTDAELASAQASVASAQANLDSLLHPASAADLASSQASVDQARIALEQLTSPASNSDMASAEASLAQAQVALVSAKLDLQRAMLSAPFDGVVATVDLAPGDTEADGTIEVIDASQMYIEISLSESDVSKVQPDMPVTLTFDAIADLEVIGNVDTVAPMATVTSNVATYPVRVSFNPGDAPIKVGMTATGTIVTQQIDDAIIVPTRAIQSMGDMQMLEVRVAPDQPTVPLRVETGLSADGQTEILSCVDTGNQCLKEGDTLVIRTTTTTSSTTQRRGGLGGFGGGGLRGGRPFP